MIRKKKEEKDEDMITYDVVFGWPSNAVVLTWSVLCHWISVGVSIPQRLEEMK